MDNAIKYSPKESAVKIEVRKYEFYVCINVKDQGMESVKKKKHKFSGGFIEAGACSRKKEPESGFILRERFFRRKKDISNSRQKWEKAVVLVFIFRGEYKEKLLRDNRNKKILQNCSFLERM